MRVLALIQSIAWRDGRPPCGTRRASCACNPSAAAQTYFPHVLEPAISSALRVARGWTEGYRPSKGRGERGDASVRVGEVADMPARRCAPGRHPARGGSQAARAPLSQRKIRHAAPRLSARRVVWGVEAQTLPACAPLGSSRFRALPRPARDAYPVTRDACVGFPRTGRVPCRVRSSAQARASPRLLAACVRLRAYQCVVLSSFFARSALSRSATVGPRAGAAAADPARRAPTAAPTAACERG